MLCGQTALLWENENGQNITLNMKALGNHSAH